MAQNPDILVANTTCMITHDGRQVMLRRGITTVRAGHPITEGREQLFDPITVHFDRGAPVEQATAAPGEKRTVQPGAGMSAESKSRARRKPADTAKDKD
jgi:hypothetical protein